MFLIVIPLVVCQGCTDKTAQTSTDNVKAATANPKFDWFKYVGNDPIYRNLSVDKDEYVNPILAGFYPDPSITRAGNDYYLINSSFAYYPGIPIFHSKNLVDWHQIGSVLERPSQLPLDGLGISEGVFAPTISYCNGTFYVLNTLAGAGGNYMVTTTNPAGSWSDPIWLDNVGGGLTRLSFLMMTGLPIF